MANVLENCIKLGSITLDNFDQALNALEKDCDLVLKAPGIIAPIVKKYAIPIKTAAQNKSYKQLLEYVRIFNKSPDTEISILKKWAFSKKDIDLVLKVEPLLEKLVASNGNTKTDKPNISTKPRTPNFNILENCIKTFTNNNVSIGLVDKMLKSLDKDCQNALLALDNDSIPHIPKPVIKTYVKGIKESVQKKDFNKLLEYIKKFNKNSDINSKLIRKIASKQDLELLLKVEPLLEELTAKK